MKYFAIEISIFKLIMVAFSVDHLSEAIRTKSVPEKNILCYKTEMDK